MNNESKSPKKTIQDEDSIISSGVTPGDKTQKEDKPVISAGVSEAPKQSAQIISAGISSTPGSEIILNNKKYKVLKTIARSTGEAEVYLVEREEEKYVFKYYYPNFKPKDSILKQLKGLHHEDAVDLIDYGYYNDRFFEIMEYAEGGGLADVNEDGTYKYIPIKDINRIKQIVKETVNALHFCHSKRIIHRDIKPENIFFKNADGTDVIIGDFGISSMLDEGLSKHMSRQARTEIYAAPEIYQSIGGKTIIGKEVDYYALGITIIHIYSGEELFKELSPYAIMKIKCDCKVYIPDDMPEELKTLINGLITVEPSKRWGYDEVQKWLNSEYVPVYYKVVETKYGDFHFGTISGEDVIVNGPAELAKLLEKYPEQGKKHLYKGTIQKWVENVDQSLYVEVRGIVEDDYPTDQDAGLTKAIYVLDPLKNYKTFVGIECNNAEEIGDAIEQESSYYKSYLTQKKNADLLLYFEARGEKNVANAFRKYAQAYKPERAFNTMVLELQGKDKFKINGVSYTSPEALLNADDATKDKLVQLLSNPDSKLSIWFEQFPNLKDNIDKWRKLGRYNKITLSYALEEKSPFHFYNNKVYNLDDFKSYFAKYLTDKSKVNEVAMPSSHFIEEADFWLKNYHSSNYSEIIVSFIKEYAANFSPDKETFNKLVTHLMQTEKSPEFHWLNIRSYIESAYENKIITENTFKKYKDFLITGFEEIIGSVDYEQQKEIIDKIRALEPQHRLVCKYDEAVRLRKEEIKKENASRKTKDTVFLTIQILLLLVFVAILVSCFFIPRIGGEIIPMIIFPMAFGVATMAKFGTYKAGFVPGIFAEIVLCIIGIVGYGWVGGDIFGKILCLIISVPVVGILIGLPFSVVGGLIYKLSCKICSEPLPDEDEIDDVFGSSCLQMWATFGIMVVLLILGITLAVAATFSGFVLIGYFILPMIIKKLQEEKFNYSIEYEEADDRKALTTALVNDNK